MEGGLRESWADSEESLVQKLPGLRWELGRLPMSALVYGVGLTRLKSCLLLESPQPLKITQSYLLEI